MKDLSKQASGETYSNLINSGLLNKQEKAFVAIITEMGIPFTVNEAIEYAKTNEHMSLKLFSNPVFMNKLPAGLKKQGVLRQVRTRNCSVKKTSAVEWEVIQDGKVQAKEKVIGYADHLQDFHLEIMNYLIQGNRSALMEATDKVSLFLRDKGRL